MHDAVDHPRRLDRVVLRGLRGHGYHGVYPEERALGQRFIADVTLGVDTRAAGMSDDLTLTANYGEIALRVVKVIEGAPVALIETLAQRIAASCLAEPHVEEVTVTVHKPGAPITVPFDDVSVTIARTVADLADAPEPRGAKGA